MKGGAPGARPVRVPWHFRRMGEAEGLADCRPRGGQARRPGHWASALHQAWEPAGAGEGGEGKTGSEERKEYGQRRAAARERGPGGEAGG